MTLTLFKTILRDQLRRPWMTLLVILSVAIGVAVVVSVDLANQSASRAFKLSTDAVVGKATDLDAVRAAMALPPSSAELFPSLRTVSVEDKLDNEDIFAKVIAAAQAGHS